MLGPIWRLWWTIAALSLLPLAVLTHVATRSPASKPKPFVERVPIAPTPTELPKSYTVCGIAGAENCWQVSAR